MKCSISLLCLLLFIAFPSLANPDSLTQHHVVVKFSPQHLFVNGLYFEVEKGIVPSGKHSLIASPSLYSGKTSNIDIYNDRDHELNAENRVKGAGIGLHHRIYIDEFKPDLLQGMYVAYGLDYHHFAVTFEREGYVREVDAEGLEYYYLRQRGFKESINRVGFVAMGGLQWPVFHKRLLVDVSMGIGYRKSKSETDYAELLFNVGPTDFGYTGAYVLANFKIGYAF